MILNFLILIILFFLLSKSAGFLIDNVKKIAERFKIKPFIVGLVLGFLTTIPEISLGINSIIKGIESVSFGNLIGGIIIIFSLIFGLSLVLNKKIETDGKVKNILLNFLYITIPIVFCFKGSFGFFDGIFFLILYIVIIFYTKNDYKVEDEIKIINKNKELKDRFNEFFNRSFLKEFLFFSISLFFLIVISGVIIDVSEYVLKELKISEFIIGLLMFSLGTNLPEITVTIKAAIKKNSELSINHLIGSAMTNIVVLSVFSLFKTFKINVNESFVFMFVFLFILLFFVIVFYKTKKSFSREEGIVLIILYFMFLISQIFFAIK